MQCSPLLPAQRQIWWLQQLAPSRFDYHIPLVVELHGVVDFRVLERSFEALLPRHPALRTTFELRGSEPVQILHEDCRFGLGRSDLRSLPVESKRASAIARAEEILRTPFDLHEAPLLRAELIEVDEGRSILAIVAHHIVFDGDSLPILAAEVSRLYRSGGVDLQETPSADEASSAYTAALESMLATPPESKLESDRAYWRQRLAAAPTSLELPTDRPRSLQKGSAGSNHFFSFERPISLKIAALAQRAKTTTFTLLTTAFQVLLARYAETEDVVVGTPLSLRSRSASGPLIGCFVQTIPLRCEIDPQRSFDSLLQVGHRSMWGAFLHRSLPFEEIVRLANIPRLPNRSPLFQVMCVQWDAQMFDPPWDFPDIHSTVLREADLGAAMFDLSLTLAETPEGIRGFVEYSTELFDEATIASMVRSFEHCLHQIVRCPDIAIETLSWADAPPVVAPVSRASSPEPASLWSLFDARVRSRPDAVALSASEGSMTYAELHAFALGVARRVLSLGAPALVGLCMERSVECVGAILGILRAGAAYVPLDPGYPEERLSSLCREASLDFVLTRSHLEHRPAFRTLRCLAVETIDADGSELHAPPPGPDSLAYVLFTSGSTGQPKGVMVEHRQVAHYVSVFSDLIALRAGDKLLQFSPLSFDVSVEEIFAPLVSGASVELRSEAMLDPQVLLRECEARGITVLDLPTAYWHELSSVIEHLPWPRSVRTLIVGGEQISRKALEAWQRVCKVELWNNYGPTECTIGATTIEISRYEAHGRVPIGRPLPGYRAYILDSQSRPLPQGMVGELAIGGRGVARGYLGSPELTAERFLPDPFSEDEGARLYRSGDRARLRGDGEIEFWGRIDRQVKLSGQRVELGEIEATLRSHPSLRDALLSVQNLDEEGRGLSAIEAYVIPNPGASVDAAMLRAYLNERLPRAWLPAKIHQVAEIPKTLHGKIDLDRLRIVSREARNEDAPVPQRSGIAGRLEMLWKSLLRVPDVDAESSFFELGGSSLLLIRLRNAIQEELGLAVSVADLFRLHDFRSQSAFLEEAEAGGKLKEEVQAPVGSRKSAMQARLRARRKGGTRDGE